MRFLDGVLVSLHLLSLSIFIFFFFGTMLFVLSVPLWWIYGLGWGRKRV